MPKMVLILAEPKKGRVLVDFAKLYQDTQELLDRLNIPVQRATRKWRELSIAGHQLIQSIAKANFDERFGYHMDEPSSAIGDERD